VKSIGSFISILCTLLLLQLVSYEVRAESIVPRFSPRARPAERGGSAPVSALPAPVPRGELNEYQQEQVARFLAGTAAVDDTLSLIAVQVQFADSLMGGRDGSARKELHDSLYFANELKHLDQYFAGASRKHLAVRWEVTGTVYTLPEEMGYYGDDELQDTRAVEMMESVIDSSDEKIDFSRYDTVMLIHAGAGQETDVADNSRVQLWSSFYSRGDIDDAFPDSTVRGLATNDLLGGLPFFVDNFMLVPESASQDDFTIGSLGIWAFELGSRLGLLPLSDSTPEGFPDSRGASSYDLMATGLYNGLVTPDLTLWPGFVPGFPSVFNRLLAGWVDPLVVEENGSYRLRDINSPVPGDTACIKIPITESEYYLVVNRVHDSNFDSLFTFADFDSNFFPDNTDSLGGAEFDFFLTVLTDPFFVKPDPNYGGRVRFFLDTGSGIYIWHIDETVIRQMTETGFLPNDFVSRKGADLEEADGVQDLDGLNDPFSLGSYFDSFRESNNATFGPRTKPATDSNSGGPTGITIGDISKIGRVMTCTVTFAPSYEETRTRWPDRASYQPPSLLDLDGAAGVEIVTLSDTANVYAFNADGSEFVDKDGQAATVEPYITAPGARWVGPPAVGDIDGLGDSEIIACDERGRVYAWNLDGTEVFDGDLDPGTTGVLYKGEYPIVSPPMLIDVNGDAIFETVLVERRSGTLAPIFVNGEGAVNRPSGADFDIVWGQPVQAQFCSPLAFGALGYTGGDTEGVAFAWADTIDGFMGFSYYPLRFRGAPGPLTPQTFKWKSGVPLPTAFPAASSIAVGDLDGNGFDEAAFTLTDGRLAVYDWEGGGPVQTSTTRAPSSLPLTLVELRSSHPSAPALGDVDGDGTLEIALWDDDYFYLYEHSKRLRTNWPQPLRPTALGDFPRLRFDERLVSPLVGDINGDERVELLFPKGDGAVHGFDAGGNRLSGFPRAVPDGAGATPAIGDLEGGGSLSLVTLGTAGSITASDAVSDTLLTSPFTGLSIQTLPGSEAGGNTDWFTYQRDLTRQGRWTRTSPPETASNPVEPGSFKVYPNPVRALEVHARVVLNKQATVRVEIYTLEGERAASKEAAANPGGVIHTPFDEAIDVGHLKSGVYILRLLIETQNGTESFVENFAILR